MSNALFPSLTTHQSMAENGVSFRTALSQRAGGLGGHAHLGRLRNSFVLLHSHFCAFLLKHVVFDQPMEAAAAVSDFWQLLGIPVDMLEDLVAVNPEWRDNQLHVNAGLQEDSSCMERLSSVVLYVFKLRKFSESRWATMGPSCRAVLCSLAVGLEQLVHLTSQDPSVYAFRGLLMGLCYLE